MRLPLQCFITVDWAEPQRGEFHGRPERTESRINDQEKKRENERARQNPQEKYEKDQASNPERRERQDPQLDPSHIQEDPARETTR
jgi:hypothetical protein